MDSHREERLLIVEIGEERIADIEPPEVAVPYLCTVERSFNLRRG